MESQSIPPFEVIAAYDYTASNNSELSFIAGDLLHCQKQDGDWWYGTCHEQNGWFPATYVDKNTITKVAQPVDDEDAHYIDVSADTEQIDQAQDQSITVFDEPKPFVGIFSYIAQNQDELSFSLGDLVLVSKESCDGWFFGMLKNNRGSGWLPSNYVRAVPVEPTTTPMSPKRTNSAELLKVMAGAYDAGPTPRKPSLISRGLKMFRNKKKTTGGVSRPASLMIEHNGMGQGMAPPVVSRTPTVPDLSALSQTIKQSTSPMNLSSIEMRSSMRDLLSRLQKAVSETAHEQEQLQDKAKETKNSSTALGAPQLTCSTDHSGQFPDPPKSEHMYSNDDSETSWSTLTTALKNRQRFVSPMSRSGESQSSIPICEPDRKDLAPASESSSTLNTAVFDDMMANNEPTGRIAEVKEEEGCRGGEESVATKVMAIHNCSADNKNELSFAKGDLLCVADAVEGWWSGYIYGNPERHGHIPKNYTRPLFPEEESIINTKSLFIDCVYESSTSGGGSVAENEERQGRRATYSRHRPERVVPTPPCEGRETPQPMPRPSVPRRTASRKIRRRAKPMSPTSRPISSIENMAPIALRSGSSEAKDPKSTRRLAPRPATVIAAFDSSENGQLSLSVGETLFVTSQNGKWWMGTTKAGISGIFPATAVQLLNSRQKEQMSPMSPSSLRSPRSPLSMTPRSPRSRISMLIDVENCPP